MESFNDIKKTYTIHEIVLGQGSPYEHNEYKNIYAGLGQYLEVNGDVLLDKLNGVYYDYSSILELMGILETDVEVILSSASEDDEPHNNGDEEYGYISMETTGEITTDYEFPLMSTEIKLYADNSQGNNCSPVAGLSLVLFFEKEFSGVTPLTSVNTPQSWNTGEVYYKWSHYRAENTSNMTGLDDIIEIYDYLYNHMGTNDYFLSFGDGTPHSKFIDGLNDYFSSVNYNMSVYEIIGNTSSYVSFFNYSFDGTDTWNEYKQNIDDNNPVVIQLGGLFDMFYTYVDEFNNGIEIIEDNPDYNRPGPYGTTFYFDSITYHYCTSNNYGSMHTVIGYGYLENKLYDIDAWGWLDDDPFRIDKFAIVSLGWGNGRKGYVNSNSIAISQAYAVSIAQST